MREDAPTCPYCNAQPTMPPGAVVGQRIPCSRCGESFKLTSVPAIAITSSPRVETPPPARTFRRSNRLVAGIVLSVMLVMAGTGLTFALLTVKERRDHDSALPRKSRRPWLTDPQAPAEAPTANDLAGLGYLPPSTNLVAALHVAELLGSPTGKGLRSRSLKIANSDFTLDSLRDWTGLEAENVEHAVLGVVVRDGDDVDGTPAVHLVVRTRKPYAPERVRAALKASKPREDRTPDGGKRTIYEASVRNVPVKLWLADERTLVVGLVKMDQLPGTPHDGLSQLPAEVRQVIEKRVAPGAPAWVAGHSANWKKTLLPTIAATMKDVPLLAHLEDVRTFAVWLTAAKPAKVWGVFGCASEEVAKKLELAELEPRQKANAEAFKYSREGAWLEMQVTIAGN